MKHIYKAPHFDLLYDDVQREGVVDEIVLGRMSFFDPFLKPVYDQWIRPGAVVVEVGAHVGTHTAYLSKLVGPVGNVIAFEPQLQLYLHLCANLWLNDCRNVTPYQTALFSHGGLIKPNVIPEDYWEVANKAGISFSPTDDPEDFGTVAGRTLDSYRLSRVDFIKIDAETLDLEVAKGAMDTIARCRPVIAFEQGDQQYGQWQEMLRPLGYTVSNLAMSNFLCTPSASIPLQV